MSETKKTRPPWTTEACSHCGNEGLASRTQPTTDDYICSDCEMYERGWNDAEKLYAEQAAKGQEATKAADALVEEVVRAMYRLYANELPSGRRAYEILAEAVGSGTLVREGLPLLHPKSNHES